MSTKTKPRLHNVTSKAALRQGSEVWILSKRYKKELEAAQMRFSRPLLGLARLAMQRNASICEKLPVSKRDRSIPKEMERTCSKNGRR
jgi:hypothetical protein